MTCDVNWQLDNIFTTSWLRCPPVMKQWHCYNFRLPDQRGHYSLSSHWPGPLDTVLPLAGSPSSVTVHHHRLGQCHDISVVPECRPLIGQKVAGDNVTHNITTNNPLSCMAVNMNIWSASHWWFSYFWNTSHHRLKCLLPWKVKRLIWYFRQPIKGPSGGELHSKMCLHLFILVKT